MTSVTATAGTIIPVHTAAKHLTVLDLDSQIQDVAAENTAFDIQWRGHTVFVLPKQTDQPNNLFVWTKAGRVVYELLPPAATVTNMDVAIDTHFPPPGPAPTAVAAAAGDAVPADLLLRSRTVGLDSKRTRRDSGLVVRDVYRDHDKLFLRYELRNDGPANLKLAGTPVVSAGLMPNFPTSAGPVQLNPDKAARTTTGAPLPLIASETGASSLAPGQSAVGVIGVRIPQVTGPLAIRVSLPANDAQATVVVP